MTRIIPNPDEERLDRRDHRVGFERVEEFMNGLVIDYPDDRPLGYEHEGRERHLGLLGDVVMLLVLEPVPGVTGVIGGSIPAA